MKKLVLCSGGLDSVVLLHKVVKKYMGDNVVALSMFYGQKHDKEMQYARYQCHKLGVKLYEVDLSAVFSFNPNVSSLLQGSNLDIEHKSYAEQIAERKGAPVTAYVPYRNGLFLSYATAVALQLDCDEIFYGAHRDDAAGSAYPDCSIEFIEAQAIAIYGGTGKKVSLTAPWWHLNKAGIVKVGLVLGMEEDAFRHTWSCYEGKEEPCGVCGTCRDRKAAFEANGIYDIL